MSTTGWQAMPPQSIVPVGQCRRQLVCPMEAPAVDHHDDRFPGVAQAGHDLVDILPQPLRINMRDDRRKNVRGAIVDGAHDAEPYATGHTTPTPIASPRLAFAVLFACEHLPQNVR